jgi:hypothetical protein
MGRRDKIILIDADVVSHFITGGAIIYLPRIFPFKIKVLDKVYAELSRFARKKTEVDNLVNFRLLEIIPFPEQDEAIRREYLYIKKHMFKGDGEAACLAVARHTQDILASSNLKDIADYCHLHAIDYLTTMDFLCEAMKKGILTEAACDSFIARVQAAGSRLPVSRMAQFTCP